jgi:hypothetical protein
MGLSHGGEEDSHYNRGSQDFVSHHKPGLYDGIDGGSGSYPGSSGGRSALKYQWVAYVFLYMTHDSNEQSKFNVDDKM